jgi:hypothetical protein
MASLQGTTSTTLSATASITADTILCTTAGSVQQWSGYVGIQTPYYDPSNNYADVLYNTNGYGWIMGYISCPANQSYNSSHEFWFALSLYGLKTQTGPTWDGLLGLSTWTSGNNSYLRFTNLYNASWAYGNYHVNATVFTGNSNSSIASSILTRVN